MTQKTEVKEKQQFMSPGKEFHLNYYTQNYFLMIIKTLTKHKPR